MRNHDLTILRRYLSVRGRKLVLFPFYYSFGHNGWLAGFSNDHVPLHEWYAGPRSGKIVAQVESQTLPGVLRNLQRKMRYYGFLVEGIPVRFSVPGLLESPPGGPVLHRDRSRAGVSSGGDPPEEPLGALSHHLQTFSVDRLVLAYDAGGEWTACIQAMLMQGTAGVPAFLQETAGGPALLPVARGRYLAEAVTNLVDVLRGQRLTAPGYANDRTPRRFSDRLYLDDRILR